MSAGWRWIAAMLIVRLWQRQRRRQGELLKNREKTLGHLADAVVLRQVETRDPAVDLPRLLAEQRRHCEQRAELARGADEKVGKLVHPGDCTGAQARSCKETSSMC